jgi:hypothetical protein
LGDLEDLFRRNGDGVPGGEFSAFGESLSLADDGEGYYVLQKLGGSKEGKGLLYLRT